MGLFGNKTCKEKSKDTSFFFTSKDVVEMEEYFRFRNNYTLTGLVEYFNAKFRCNRIVELLGDALDKGVKISPKVMFEPKTERCKVTDGTFSLTNLPYKMDSSWFINNLVVVKLDNGTYEFFDNVDFLIDTMTCKLSDSTINGYASVSYFVITTDNT